MRPSILVVVPTVLGREASLQRCLDAYQSRSAGAELTIRVAEGAGSCGEGWLAGAEDAPCQFVHLSADDLEPHEGWWQPLVEACDRGELPCPVVLMPDGTVQSAGGDFAQENHLRSWIAEDWTTVPWPTVPFMSLTQWHQVWMLPIQYCSDAWVGVRGAQLGYRTVLRTGSRFTHHNETAGRLSTHATDMDMFARAVAQVAA